MTLPNFIGIGAAKCGTTWMHNLLQQHPNIYMPQKRKEIDFFNVKSNYSRGIDWYESFFPSSQAANKYQAIGEFSPRYLCGVTTAQKLAKIESVEKLLLMVRNPVDRTYAQYSHAMRNGCTKSFADYLEERPRVIEHSLYAQQLESFLEFYEPNQICCSIFEESVIDIPGTKHRIADFLGVSATDFPEAAGSKKFNQSYVPKYKWLNNIARDFNQLCRKNNLDWIVNISETFKVRQLLQETAKTKVPPLAQSMRLKLSEIFIKDIEQLEKLFDINLDIWRSQIK